METESNSEEQETLTSTQAAAVLGIEAQTLRRLVKEGYIRSLPGIKAIRIPRSALDDYINGGEAA